MKLTTQQAYVLLQKHGCYITEICDCCGNSIGPVRFTRRDDSGVWCGRECRDGKEAREPGTCQLPEWFTQTVGNQVVTGPNKSEVDADAG